MTFAITFLKDYPEYTTAVAKWSFDACSLSDKKVTLKNQIKMFKQHCNRDRLPLTLIALTGNSELVGMCSLREAEGIRPDLTPWMSSLYVLPTYRNQHAGKKLIDAVKRVARSFDYTNLYVLTFDVN